MQANARAMDAVVQRIKSLGIAAEDIQTTGINLGAQYDYDQAAQRQVFRGYQASNRVSVTLRDVKRTGPVLDGRTYAELSKPSSYVKPITFGAVAPGLFDAIVKNRVPPSPVPPALHNKPVSRSGA